MAEHATSLVAHQFNDAKQQRQSAELGMWTFLATEVMFFGGLFLAYTVYRAAHPEAFSAASHHLNEWLGAINTAVLLTSSLTMALAVHAARGGNRAQLIRFLLITMALGAAFLVIKAFEYAEEYRHGLIPGRFFTYDGPHAKYVELFMALYFCMTGLHAIHMIVGLGILGTIVWMARRGRFSPAYNTPVDIAGLYWHFVDLVWIFLFPLLYLVH